MGHTRKNAGRYSVTVIDYIYRLQGSQQELFRVIHSFLSDYPLTSSIKYGIPFYSGTKIVCYANAQKPAGLEIVFWRAPEMKESSPHLALKKRKSMAGIQYASLDDVNFEILDTLLLEALRCDISK